MSRPLAMASLALITLLALCGCAGVYVAGDTGVDHPRIEGAAAR
jgi:hypothetical protein